eukprot:scaffold67648_cov38-Attheya_sp.AAC.3
MGNANRPGADNPTTSANRGRNASTETTVDPWSTNHEPALGGDLCVDSKDSRLHDTSSHPDTFGGLSTRYNNGAGYGGVRHADT